METFNDVPWPLNDLLRMRTQQINILEKYAEGLFSTFQKVEPNEKVKFLYNIFQREGILPSVIIESTKSTKLALDYKSLGNKAYLLEKNDAEAIKYYTKSIVAALSGSEELSTAFANRSAVFFRLKKYELCIQDIDRALGKSYPDSLKSKLLERKGRCFLEIGPIKKARKCFKDALSYVSKLNIDSKQRTEKEKELNHLINACDGRKSVSKEKDYFRSKNTSSVTIRSRNKYIPNASDKIQLTYSEKMGRQISATSDIEPCEILSVEKPFAATLNPIFFFTHCSNCFTRNDCMIPCDECSSVMFCDEKCREECMNRFHAVECEILDTLVKLGADSKGLLAVRILMTACEQGKKLIDLYSHPDFGKALPYLPSSESYKAGELFNSEDYKFVHTLQDNVLKMSDTMRLYVDATNVVKILHLLKQSSFFDYVKEKLNEGILDYKLADLEMYAGTLLLKYFLLVDGNTFKIAEKISGASVMNAENELFDIGRGLYPFTGLMNHSCDSNAVVIFSGNKSVVCALQPISAGQQVFYSYQTHYVIDNLERRQSYLQDSHFFKCECAACKFDWPQLWNLPSGDPIYLSSRVDKKKIRESTKNFGKMLFKLKIQNKQDRDCLKHLSQHLSLLHKSIKKPFEEYHLCEQMILEYLLLLKGNSYHAHTLLNVII